MPTTASGVRRRRGSTSCGRWAERWPRSSWSAWARTTPPGSEPEFRRLVDEAVAIVGPRRCLVWATIVRDGTGRTGFDRVLRDAQSDNPNLRLVEWTRLVEQDPTLLAGDAVHGTSDGYARRAEETAQAIRGCPGA